MGSHNGGTAILMAFSMACGAQPHPGVEAISMAIGDVDPVEVGVLTPAGRFIYMRSAEIGCDGVDIVDGRLSINVLAAGGYFWDSQGKRFTTPAFAGKGVYTIYISDNLETEIQSASTITKTYQLDRDLSDWTTSLRACREIK